MDWWLILAIAVPFLFVIGVLNNAFKDQKRLENGKLKKYLENRVVKKDKAYDDDDDDWGVQARQDLKRAVAEQEAQNNDQAHDAKAKESADAAAASSSSASSDSEAKKDDGPLYSRERDAFDPKPKEDDKAKASSKSEADGSIKERGYAPKDENFKPLGDTKAKSAASYFANYYKDE